jgi:hypothetical protein
MPVRSPRIRFPYRKPEGGNLTSESTRPAKGLSRRLMLAGLAALPAALPAAAEQSADPIFAAIDAFRRADAACVAVNGDIPDEVGDLWSEAISTVLRTRPTTPAGLAALTTFSRERADWLKANGTEGGDDFCTASATIDDATRGMSGLQPWSPPQSMIVAGEPDPVFAAIEKHKQALRQMTAASREAKRLMKLAEKKFGPHKELAEKDRKAFVDYLDTISPNGDHDTVIEPAANHLGDATWDLSQTVPNSLSGLLAFASYARQVIEHKETTFDENDLQNMLLSLAEAADAVRAADIS